MLGRAGRPKYDKGEAWVYCKGTDGEVADAVRTAISSGSSKTFHPNWPLNLPSVMHVLASIATGGLVHKGQLNTFFLYVLGSIHASSQLVNADQHVGLAG